MIGGEAVLGADATQAHVLVEGEEAGDHRLLVAGDDPGLRHAVVEAGDVFVLQGGEGVARRVEVVDLVLGGLVEQVRPDQRLADLVVDLDHAGAVAADARHAVADGVVLLARVLDDRLWALVEASAELVGQHVALEAILQGEDDLAAVEVEVERVDEDVLLIGLAGEVVADPEGAVAVAIDEVALDDAVEARHVRLLEAGAAGEVLVEGELGVDLREDVDPELGLQALVDGALGAAGRVVLVEPCAALGDAEDVVVQRRARAGVDEGVALNDREQGVGVGLEVGRDLAEVLDGVGILVGHHLPDVAILLRELGLLRGVGVGAVGAVVERVGVAEVERGLAELERLQVGARLPLVVGEVDAEDEALGVDRQRGGDQRAVREAVDQLRERLAKQLDLGVAPASVVEVHEGEVAGGLLGLEVDLAEILIDHLQHFARVVERLVAAALHAGALVDPLADDVDVGVARAHGLGQRWHRRLGVGHTRVDPRALGVAGGDLALGDQLLEVEDVADAALPGAAGPVALGAVALEDAEHARLEVDAGRGHAVAALGALGRPAGHAAAALGAGAVAGIRGVGVFLEDHRRACPERQV